MFLMINMRIFKTVLLIAYLGASARCLPIDGESTTESKTEVFASSTAEATTESKTEVFVSSTTTDASPASPAVPQSDTNYYDQRQNGSENYRIHVDGVVLVFAPVEALLLAGATAGPTASTLPIPEHGGSVQLDGPKPNSEKPDLQNKTELASSKTIHRSPLRLAHLLAPFLRRLHPEHASIH